MQNAKSKDTVEAVAGDAIAELVDGCHLEINVVDLFLIGLLFGNFNHFGGDVSRKDMFDMVGMDEAGSSGSTTKLK